MATWTATADEQRGAGWRTDPNNPDTDGDGVSDGDEVAAGLRTACGCDQSAGDAPFSVALLLLIAGAVESAGGPVL